MAEGTEVMKLTKRSLKNSFLLNILFCYSTIQPADTIRALQQRISSLKIPAIALPSFFTTHPFTIIAATLVTIGTYFGIKRLFTHHESSNPALEHTVNSYLAEWHNYKLLYSAAAPLVSEAFKTTLEEDHLYQYMPLLENKKISHALADGGRHTVIIENWDTQNNYDATLSIADHALTGVTLKHHISQHTIHTQPNFTELLATISMLWKAKHEQETAYHEWTMKHQEKIVSRLISWLWDWLWEKDTEHIQKRLSEARLLDAVIKAAEEKLCTKELTGKLLCTRGARCAANNLVAAYKEYKCQLAADGKDFTRDLGKKIITTLSPTDQCSFQACKQLHDALEHTKLTLEEVITIEKQLMQPRT